MEKETCNICDEKIPTTISLWRMCLGVSILVCVGIFWILVAIDSIDPSDIVKFSSCVIAIPGLNLTTEAIFRRCPNEGLMAKNPEKMHFDD